LEGNEVSEGDQASALGWSFLGDFSRQGVTFLVSIVLARLLLPEDFGLVGMSMAFIAILSVLVDGGFSKALIQAKDVDATSFDSVFYVNLGVGVLAMIILYFLAPFIGVFYEDETVRDLVRWLSLLVPINALSVVHNAIFTRELRFKELGIRSVVAGTGGGIVGIVMALSGYGVYALVGQSLTGGLLGVLVLWWAADWRPGRRFSFARLQEISSFGRFVFAASLLSRSISEIYALFIGKLFSPATLGFFTRSQSFSQLVVRYTSGVVMKVYLPVFSKIQNEEEKFRELFFRVAGLTAWATFLLSGVLILSAELLIVTLFGEKWLPSVGIFQILMFSLFNYPINSLLVNALLAKGLSRNNFHYNLLRSMLRLTPLLFGWLYGFKFFLLSLVAISYLGTLMNSWLVGRDLGFSFWRQLQEFYQWLGLFVFALLPAGALYFYMESFFGAGAGAKWASTGISVLLYLLLYVGLSYLFRPKIKLLLSKSFSLIQAKLNHK
jgi:O-antigen/teichoic acid export membrane protein